MPAYLTRIIIITACLASPAFSVAQSTSENAEARVYFEEGNRLFQQASRASGSKRTTLLQRSLEAYVDSLQIVRSRNALFNAAIVLEELDRNDESFNYYTEYLRIEGLTEADREEASRRRDALRPKVAVLRVSSEPEAAQLWVDRKDLAARGETPIEVAVPPGQHRVFVEKEGYVPAERALKMVHGEATVLDLRLEPLPVEPVVEAGPADTYEKPRLRNAAIGTAASTIATAAVGLGLSLKARSLHDEYDNAAAQYEMTGEPADLQRAQDLANRTDRFNIAADVMWGTTIALGISAIVLYTQHRKRQRREKARVDVSVSRHGGFASVRMPLGASR
ncbi:MAG: PEGA domain-containing protein [Deltaproteobacteria bacterium]|nr:PEGA domain-containing protein [Deltaproteobacteria bacterium]